MKKKVGIITLYGLENYGNRLQNYAVHKILYKMGYKSKTFVYLKDTRFAYLKNTRNMKRLFKWRINRVSNYRFSSDASIAKINSRDLVFNAFTRKYIPTKNITSLDGLSKEADYFVIGSDQVWNPSWYKGKDKELFLLTFANPCQKVCFAPSFGVEQLSKEWRDYFKSNLSEYRDISVREETGAKIIYELTGKKAEVLIDPTLMIEKDEWLKISRKPRNIDCDEPFVLTYFLGDFSVEAEKLIAKISRENNFRTYRLMDKKYPDLYCCGPSEFIYLFSKASLILTDSFHACIFSFLFEKPFLVYERKDNNANMSSRIDTLLNILDIQRKSASSKLDNHLFEHDYSTGEKILATKKYETLNFLYNSFKRG